MEDSWVAEMAQSDAVEDASAVSMRAYWIQKLGLAALQAVGVSQSDLQYLAEEMNLTALKRKLEEHRRHWIHQPTDAENKRATALLDARFADAGLKALGGLYTEASDVCDELLSNETEHGSSSIKSKIRVAGVKGLVHALKGEWQAAQNFLVRSMTQVLEQFVSSDGNDDFFFDDVVLTLGDALGYLLIHLVESDGSTRDSLQSSAILNPCDKSHALFVVMLFGLGLLGGGAEFEVTTCTVERLMVDIAKQVSRRSFGASSCLCSYALEKVYATVIRESKDKDIEVPTLVADNLRPAESIRLAQSAGKNTHLEGSCLDRLGDLGTEGGNPFLSLKTDSSALRLKLSVCAGNPVIEADPEVRILCQRLLENILQIPALEDIDAELNSRPPADAHHVDVMVYSLCIIAFLEKDRKLEALEEVAEAVFRFQHVMKDAVCIKKCLFGLTSEYLKRRADGNAAAIFLLCSNISTTLEDKLLLRYNGAVYLNRAGELGMALEVIKDMTRASMQLDESLWESRIILCTGAALLFAMGDEADLEIAAMEEACRILCAHATTYFTDCEVASNVILGISALLQHYIVRRNWVAACKLVLSLDAHIARYFCKERREEPTWVYWQAAKYFLAMQRGNDDIAEELLLSRKLCAGDDINRKILFDILVSYQKVEDSANRGLFEEAIKETEVILELIQNISPRMDKHREEVEVHISRSAIYSAWNKLIPAHDEMEKVIEVVNSVEYQDMRERSRRSFVHFLCIHAVGCYLDGNVKESERLMGIVKSKVSRCNNAWELAEVEFSEAYMLDHKEQWEEAAVKARPLILLLLKEQRRFGHLDHEPLSWLSFFRTSRLDERLWYIQCVYSYRISSIHGLVWAERSQQRFLIHQIYNQPRKTAIPNPSDLDECDQLLISLIIQTTEALRSKTSIIVYSYHSRTENILMFVAKMNYDDDEFELRSKFSGSLPTWFEENGFGRNRSLEDLIEASIDEEGPSIEALSILHAFLIQYIQEYLEGCDSLIFVPGHGNLAKVPFAALYDSRHNKHLIEDYNVAVVPSIVILHHCLYRQCNFERSSRFLGPNLLQDSSLEARPLKQSLQFDGQSNFPRNGAFIAGNPEPMGCGLPQLPGAEEEAKEVAKLFKVTPCVTKDMTKQAVIEGLSTSEVVLLATHGKVDDDYPHGCLVLQASPKCQEVTPTPPLQSELDKLAHDEAVASTSTSTLPPTMDTFTTNKEINDIIALISSIASPELSNPPLTTAELSKGKGIAEGEVVASTSTSILSARMNLLTLNKELNDMAALTSSTATPKVSSPPLTTAELSKGKGVAEEQEQDFPLHYDGHQEGKRSLRLFEFSDEVTKHFRAKEASQVLTAEEIVALKGGISAGLVVLSACQSGLGEATAGEGLWGLGRALLQAGAVSTILTLWKVDDGFTSRFITDLFKELLRTEPPGRSVDECMRKVMLNMIREGQPLKHWAAFTIVGSPTLRLRKPDNSTWGASLLGKHSYHLSGMDNVCSHPCRVCRKREETRNSKRSATNFDDPNRVGIESMRNI